MVPPGLDVAMFPVSSADGLMDSGEQRLATRCQKLCTRRCFRPRGGCEKGRDKTKGKQGKQLAGIPHGAGALAASRQVG
eukprot:146686-Amphidinium_carterae.1